MLYENGIQKPVSGFYYDQQLNNPLTCVTLHKNTVYGGGVWSDSARDDPDVAYDAKPLITSVLLEDPVLTVTNNWSQFGNDFIGQLWDSLKPFAPYIDNLGDTLNEVAKELSSEVKKNWSSPSDGGSMGALEKAAKKGMEYAPGVFRGFAALAAKGGNLLNRSLITQGTRFTYYSGTNCSFGGLQMNITVLSDFSRGGSWEPAEDKIAGLYEYVIGKMTPVRLDPEVVGQIAEWISQYAFWQEAPGGYEADMKDVDKEQRGTLRLRIGGFYSISSLVVESAIFRYSKQMVKDPMSPGKIHPAFIEIVLQLRPVSKFTDEFLMKFFNGVHTQQWRSANVEGPLAGIVG